MKTGRRIIALLCSVLLLAFAASYNSRALADEVPELNWADLEWSFQACRAFRDGGSDQVCHSFCLRGIQPG